jgi:hypothetical protein
VTFVVASHVDDRVVGHALAAMHVVAIDVTPQFGYWPVPSGTSMPQQTGVDGVAAHSSGPSHVIWSAVGQLAGSSQANGGVWFGCVQHTIDVKHGVESSQPKSYMLASIFVTGASCMIAEPSCFVELSMGVVCDDPHAAAMASMATHVMAEQRGDMAGRYSVSPSAVRSFMYGALRDHAAAQAASAAIRYEATPTHRRRVTRR